MALSLVLDGAQSRVQRGRTCAFHQGASNAQGGGFVSNWSDIYSAHTWISPVGYFAMKRPNVLYKEFYQGAAGAYARWGYADFGITAGTDGWLPPSSVAFNGENRFYRTEEMTVPVASVTDLVVDNDGIFIEFSTTPRTQGPR